MKWFKYILIAPIVLMTIACTKEIALEANQNNNPNLVSLEFTASADLEEETLGANDNTKVFYDAETQTTQWKVGDAVKIIAANGNAYDFSDTLVTEKS